MPGEVSYGGTSVQGGRQVRLESVQRDRATVVVPPGSLRVPMAQPPGVETRASTMTKSLPDPVIL